MHDYSHSTTLKRILILFSSFFFVSIYPILLYDSESIVLAVNSLHRPILDSMATIGTFFGSLWFYILFLGGLVLFKKTIRAVLFAGVSFFNTCVIVQAMKHIIFGALPRPIDTISLENLHIVKNFSHDHYNTFPSGHASTIFVLITVLCIFLIDNSTYLHIILLVLASLVAISRLYLCMHFYHDVYVGALIGYSCTMLTYCGMCKISWPAWTNNSFYQLFNVFSQ